MKKTKLYLKSMLCAITLVACESHEQKADEAFKNFKEEKISLIDSAVTLKDSSNPILKTPPNKKVIKLDECLKYRADLEEKVKANDLAISKLKKENHSNTKTYHKITHLEDVNNLFINELKDYEQKVKTDRKAFEEKLNQELNDMNLSIKEYNTLK